MEVQVKEIEARSILTPQKVGSLTGAFDYSLNPYAVIGVQAQALGRQALTSCNDPV